MAGERTYTPAEYKRKVESGDWEEVWEPDRNGRATIKQRRGGQMTIRVEEKQRDDSTLNDAADAIAQRADALTRRMDAVEREDAAGRVSARARGDASQPPSSYGRAMTSARSAGANEKAGKDQRVAPITKSGVLGKDDNGKRFTVEGALAEVKRLEGLNPGTKFGHTKTWT